MRLATLRGEEHEKSQGLSGPWNVILEAIEAQILLLKLDLTDALEGVVKKAFYAAVFLVISVTGFALLNIAAVLWLQTLFIDSWMPVLAMGLLYVALGLLFLLGPGRKLGRALGSRSVKKADLRKTLEEKRAKLTGRESLKPLLSTVAFPLVFCALAMGFLAAPRQRARERLYGGQTSSGSGIMKTLTVNVVGRILDRILDLYLPTTKRRQ